MSAEYRGERVWGAAVALGLLALILREYYLATARVDHPFVGDAGQYASYAWNLVQNGVFSSAAPGSTAIIADDFRGPGYAALIASAMSGTGSESPTWYLLVLHLQALLGAATVAITVLIGAKCDRLATGAIAGLLLAFWPHHIAATGALLSEVAFGSALSLAMLFSLLALDGPRWAKVIAGAAWGYAYLINPVVLLFPLAIAQWKARVWGWRNTVSFVACLLLAVLGWGFRSATLQVPHQPGRATINFVQGSWPIYHDAWLEMRLGDPYAKKVIEEVNAEVAALDQDPARGFGKMATRMKQDSGYYLKWYLWWKPYLLWDWSIRIGSADTYMVITTHSPLEGEGFLAKAKLLLKRLNPLIFLAALLAAGIALFRSRQSHQAVQASAVIAAAFVYFTLAHLVFQAEPRYSIPYRFIEMLLASMLVTSTAAWLQRRVGRALPDHESA